MSQSTGELTLDEAVQDFKQWAQGSDGMDELDFKEYLIDVWLPRKFIERSKVKHGWKPNGEML